MTILPGYGDPTLENVATKVIDDEILDNPSMSGYNAEGENPTS